MCEFIVGIVCFGVIMNTYFIFETLEWDNYYN